MLTVYYIKYYPFVDRSFFFWLYWPVTSFTNAISGGRAMSIVQQILNFFGYRQPIPTASPASEANSPVAAPTPWNILWDGVVYDCSSRYQMNGLPFFQQNLEINGIQLVVQVMRMAGYQNLNWIFIYPDLEKRGVREMYQALKGRAAYLKLNEDGTVSPTTLTPSRNDQRSVTTDLKAAILDLANQGVLDRVLRP